MLNPYIWELYLKSGGDQVVSFFKDNLVPSLSKDYAERIYFLQKQYCVSKSILNITKEELLELASYLSKLKNEDFEEITDCLDEDVDEGPVYEEIDAVFDEYYQSLLDEVETDKEAFNLFIQGIFGQTTWFAIWNPDLFVPYYFYSTYNVLMIISDTFGIKLPDIPKKTDYKARMWHYADLCKSFYHFRRENHLSYCELCAFLYDFAPRYIGGIDSYIIKDLPDPKAAFFVGGGGG